MSAALEIRDRVKELRRVKASELRVNPANPRTHPEAQGGALAAMLARLGVAAAVVARELPGGALELIDGHLRTELLAEQEIPVLVLDVTEQEARELLATMDAIGGMAEPDTEKLGALLAELGPTSSDPLDAFLAGIVSGPEPEPVPTPAPRVPPAEFPEVDENLEVAHSCPGCGYKWSGGGA